MRPPRPRRALVVSFAAMPHRRHLLELLPRLEEIPGFDPWRSYVFVRAALVEPIAPVLRASARTAIAFALQHLMSHSSSLTEGHVDPSWGSLFAALGRRLELEPLLSPQDLELHWPDPSTRPALLLALEAKTARPERCRARERSSARANFI